MNFLDSLKKTEFLLIEGEKKVGKLTFSLYDAYLNGSKKVLIFTTYAKTIFAKRLEAVKNQNIEEINQILKKTRYLALKETWPEYKAKFGIDFLLKDIYRAIEKEKPDYVIFHRFDLFFEPFEDNLVKMFIEKIIDYKTQFNLKTIFTTIGSSENEIVETIENFSDLNLEIIKKEEKRVIKVKNSIFPIKTTNCLFAIFNNKINLLPESQKTMEEIKSPEKEKFRILIITKNQTLKKRLSYIFSKPIFEIDFAEKVSEIIKKVMTNPDIIIYNPLENELDFSVCETIQEQKLKSKLIYVTNENYIRSDDKITAINHGCYDIFPINFNIIDFISEIEKLLGMNFYTYNIRNLKMSYKITSKNMLCTVLENLYEEKIYFTLLKLKTSLEIDISKLRDHDFYYKEGNLYYLILINTTKDFIQNILKKFNKEDYEILKVTEAYESTELIEEICK